MGIVYSNYNPATFRTLNTEESLFSDAWIAENAYNESGVKASIGQSATTLRSSMTSNHMDFTGPVGAIFGVKPILREFNAIEFNNEPFSCYRGSVLGSPVLVYETWQVATFYYSQDSEKMIELPYRGTGTGNTFRIDQPDRIIPNVYLPKFVKTIIRIKHFANRTSQLFINGVYKGVTDTESEDFPFSQPTMGCDTNCLEYDFHAYYVKYGHFTDSVANTITTSLTNKYGVGIQLPRMILPNIKLVNSGSNYNVTFNKFKNDGLVYRPISEWDIKTVGRRISSSGGNFQYQPTLPGISKLSFTVTEANAAVALYNSANPSIPIESTTFKVLVRPKLQSGVIAKWQSGVFETY